MLTRMQYVDHHTVWSAALVWSVLWIRRSTYMRMDCPSLGFCNDDITLGRHMN